MSIRFPFPSLLLCMTLVLSACERKENSTPKPASPTPSFGSQLSSDLFSACRDLVATARGGALPAFDTPEYLPALALIQQTLKNQPTNSRALYLLAYATTPFNPYDAEAHLVEATRLGLPPRQQALATAHINALRSAKLSSSYDFRPLFASLERITTDLNTECGTDPGGLPNLGLESRPNQGQSETPATRLPPVANPSAPSEIQGSTTAKHFHRLLSPPLRQLCESFAQRRRAGERDDPVWLEVLAKQLSRSPRDAVALYLRAAILDDSDPQKAYADYRAAAQLGLPPMQQRLVDNLIAAMHAVRVGDANIYLFIGSQASIRENILAECSSDSAVVTDRQRSRYNEHATLLRRLERDGYSVPVVKALRELELENPTQLAECVAVLRTLVANDRPSGNQQLIAAWARLGFEMILKHFDDKSPRTPLQMSALRLLHDWATVDFGPNRKATTIRSAFVTWYGEEVAARRIEHLRKAMNESIDQRESTRKSWEDLLA